MAGDWKIFIADSFERKPIDRVKLTNFLAIKKSEVKSQWVCIVWGDEDDFTLDSFQDLYHIDNLMLSLFDYVISVNTGVQAVEVDFLYHRNVDMGTMEKLQTLAEKMYAERMKLGNSDKYPDLNLVL